MAMPFEAMTERYNKKKRQLEAKKEILAKSPAFSPIPPHTGYS